MAPRLSGKGGVDMTVGGVAAHLLRFALPLLVGNFFQQLYNTVDAWVVGNYVSNEAFSAVGTVSPVIFMLIGFFNGFSSGSSVVISQYFGAKQYDQVNDAAHTAITATFLLGVLFTGVGILITPSMLRLMKTPPEVMPESTAYLQIYFLGILGLMLYNIGSGILLAVGDSRRPFYFLVFSAVVNIALDLLFVLRFRLGVRGVAYATILSQALSALLVFATLWWSNSCVQFRFRRARLHRDLLKKILRVGLPAAIQISLTSFSNVFVQSYINHFGTDYMSGWGAYIKLDQFFLLPMQSVALALTTFVGQNLGVNNLRRVRQGVRSALLLAEACTFVTVAAAVLGAPAIVGFFNDKPEVVQAGTMYLRWVAPFYLVHCIGQTYIAALRGAGNTKVPMVILLTSYVVLRQLYLFVMANFIANEVIPIAMGYPIGWIAAALITFCYYRTVDLARTRVVETPDG